MLLSLYSNNGYYILRHRIKHLDISKCNNCIVAFRTDKLVVSDDDVVALNGSEVTVGCMSDWLPRILSLSDRGPEAYHKRPLM